MSRRKRKIQLGRIYRTEDPSGYGHYGRPYRYNKKSKDYDVVKFSSKKRKSYSLNRNIDSSNNKDKSFVRKRPERVGANYIKKEAPSTFVIVDPIDKSIIRHVKKNKIKIHGKKKK